MVFSSWQAILAVILGIMWVMRRHEPAYGLLAAAMAVGVAQAFLQTPMGETAFSRLNVVLISSAPLESGLVLTFALLFSGWKWRPYGWIIFVPGLLLALAGLFGNQALSRTLFLLIAVPMVGVSLVIMAAVTARSVLKRPNVAGLLLGCAVTIMLTCWVVDLLSVFQMMPNRIFTARLSYSAMLVAIGAGLTWRFARALNEVDGFAGRLVTQVREAEEKLKASFIREEERARAAALARERTRLMRDLHDGLGGQLVSIVALSERGNAGAEIGDAARAALKDLRLVIDSMDDIGGDLMLALGSWRERAMAQLRPHDIALEWRAVTPQGLPVHPELRPWHVIQIVRLLDEALTKAVKHANARRVTVRIETIAGGDGLDRGCITVEDDGNGFDVPRRTDPPGWRKRRAACAICEPARRGVARRWCWTPARKVTRVRLTLPHRFPDSDACRRLNLRQRRPTRFTGPPRFRGVPGRTPTPRAPTPTQRDADTGNADRRRHHCGRRSGVGRITQPWARRPSCSKPPRPGPNPRRPARTTPQRKTPPGPDPHSAILFSSTCHLSDRRAALRCADRSPQPT